MAGDDLDALHEPEQHDLLGGAGRQMNLVNDGANTLRKIESGKSCISRLESVALARSGASASPEAERRWPTCVERVPAERGDVMVLEDGARFANLKIIFNSNSIVQPERRGVNYKYHAQM